VGDLSVGPGGSWNHGVQIDWTTSFSIQEGSRICIPNASIQSLGGDGGAAQEHGYYCRMIECRIGKLSLRDRGREDIFWGTSGWEGAVSVRFVEKSFFLT